MAEMKQGSPALLPPPMGSEPVPPPLSSFVGAPSSTETTSSEATATTNGAKPGWLEGSGGGEKGDVESGKGKGKGTGAEGKGVAAQGKGDAGAAMSAACAATVAGSGGSGGPERYNWMPSLRETKPSRECIRRVRNDIRSVMRDPVPGLFVYPDEELVTVVHALVTGPFDTPYEGGFFYFVLHCPDDYPHSPPRVRLMTTGGGTVRFNPNLYANGKVCLSILGTWNGPRWTPVHSISSVLLSIQSLMNEKPYHNEPGFEATSNPQDVRDYNDCITHETLRVAVCSMVDGSSLWNSMPACFQALTRDLFSSFVPRYDLVCEQNMHRDGEKMNDPFGQNKGTFRYASIARSIKRLAGMLKEVAEGDEADSPPSGQEEGARSTQQADATAVAGIDECGGSRSHAEASSGGAKRNEISSAACPTEGKDGQDAGCAAAASGDSSTSNVLRVLR